MITSSRNHGSHPHARQRGFSLPELLVVIGVVFTLLALALPALGRSKQVAGEAVSLSNIRQVGIALTFYADQHDDLMPEFFRPELAFDDTGPLSYYETRWGSVGNFWFYHTVFYQIALDATIGALPPEVIFAPGRNGETSEVDAIFGPSYIISQTFYADPVYWNRFTQIAPDQWHAQRLSAVRFPSGKGFAYQHARPDLPSSGILPVMACCTPDMPPTAILWADLSAQTAVIGSFRLGEPNFYHHSGTGYGSYNQDGAPIVNTRDGVHGLDR